MTAVVEGVAIQPSGLKRDVAESAGPERKRSLAVASGFGDFSFARSAAAVLNSTRRRGRSTAGRTTVLTAALVAVQRGKREALQVLEGNRQFSQARANDCTNTLALSNSIAVLGSKRPHFTRECLWT